MTQDFVDGPALSPALSRLRERGGAEGLSLHEVKTVDRPRPQDSRPPSPRVGNRTIHTLTPTAHASNAADTSGRPRSSHAVVPIDSHIIDSARHFALNGMLRWRCQSLTSGPKRGCPSSHSWKRCEPRAKQAAASSTNGVVGSTGRKMPTTPSSRHSPPSATQTARSTRWRWLSTASGSGSGERSGVEGGNGRRKAARAAR
ncbi:hypothetical protein CBM2609_A40128 [Cupriavidus taiwanensis]|nr:hypothetical protein CBM2604_A30208 [Cupriavidus taiwanensis]SOZ26783.1 hypothetical protein CBM2609_A40128 [Cupriavidus taiwanensis]SOZ45505.1 hypothetical protein CBM2610_A50120 [Cupriavidus taiwanensis]